jgi:hypothetical protein
MNPYASYLGDRDPIKVIEGTGEQLTTLVDTLGHEGLHRSLGPGKWTAAEILVHLADTEVAFAFRLRQTLAEADHVIQPFDQDAWSKGWDHADGRLALDVFRTIRLWNIAFLRGVPDSARTKQVTHPERGKMTFQTIVETMAGHDLNHTIQIEKIAAMAAGH